MPPKSLGLKNIFYYPDKKSTGITGYLILVFLPVLLELEKA